MTDDEGVEGMSVGSKQAAMAGSEYGESVLWLLPDELLLYILGFLDARCLGSVTQVCLSAHFLSRPLPIRAQPFTSCCFITRDCMLVAFASMCVATLSWWSLPFFSSF